MYVNNNGKYIPYMDPVGNGKLVLWGPVVWIPKGSPYEKGIVGAPSWVRAPRLNSHRIHGTGLPTFTIVYHEIQRNVGKYRIHGSQGIQIQLSRKHRENCT